VHGSPSGACLRASDTIGVRPGTAPFGTIGDATRRFAPLDIALALC
jgi:hypothetical protein